MRHLAGRLPDGSYRFEKHFDLFCLFLHAPKKVVQVGTSETLHNGAQKGCTTTSFWVFVTVRRAPCRAELVAGMPGVSTGHRPANSSAWVPCILCRTQRLQASQGDPGIAAYVGFRSPASLRFCLNATM